MDLYEAPISQHRQNFQQVRILGDHNRENDQSSSFSISVPNIIAANLPRIKSEVTIITEERLAVVPKDTNLQPVPQPEQQEQPLLQQPKRCRLPLTSEEDCSNTPLRKKRKQRRLESAAVIPVEAKLVHVVPTKDRTKVDHTYRDYSQVPPSVDYTGEPHDINQMSFVQKVHYLLLSSSQDASVSKCLWWLPHGRAFKLCDLDDLEQSQILFKYFGIKRAAIFLLTLASHGFKVLTTGKDRGAFYHECMLRDLPHLTSYIPPPRDIRVLKPDPTNEPSFYSISKSYPLPC